jgi:hypothetical protein
MLLITEVFTCYLLITHVTLLDYLLNKKVDRWYL